MAFAQVSDVDELRVRRAQAGDSDAFAELVDLHGRDVERVALRILRNADDARDAAQDAWIRVAANLTSIRDVRRFQPWLRRIARNCSLDLISRPGRLSTSTGNDELMDALPDHAGLTPEQHLLSWDEQHAVWEVLGRLPTADRVVLHLWGNEGLRHAEIAVRLGITRHAAEVRVSRARDRFRAQYGTIRSARPGCLVSPVDLGAYVDGSAGTQQCDLVLGHLALCGACDERVMAMREGRQLYRAFSPFWLLTGGAPGLGAHVHLLVTKALTLVGIGSAGGSSAVGAGAAAGTVAASSAAVAATGTVAATGGLAIGTTVAGGIVAVVLAAAATVGMVAPSMLTGHESASAETDGAALVATTTDGGQRGPDKPLLQAAPSGPPVPDISVAAAGNGPSASAPTAPSISASATGAPALGPELEPPLSGVAVAPTPLTAGAAETAVGGLHGAGSDAGILAGTAQQAESDAESARQQAESDATSARQQAESDATSARQQAESDATSADQQAESDATSADQQAESDATSAEQQAESDATSADQQAESDAESARQQAESDAKSGKS